MSRVSPPRLSQRFLPRLVPPIHSFGEEFLKGKFKPHNFLSQKARYKNPTKFCSVDGITRKLHSRNYRSNSLFLPTPRTTLFVTGLRPVLRPFPCLPRIRPRGRRHGAPGGPHSPPRHPPAPRHGLHRRGAGFACWLFPWALFSCKSLSPGGGDGRWAGRWVGGWGGGGFAPLRFFLLNNALNFPEFYGPTCCLKGSLASIDVWCGGCAASPGQSQLGEHINRCGGVYHIKRWM